MKIAVIDGQGGGIGKSIIEKLSKEKIFLDKNIELIALGTNSSATIGMIKSGAHNGATGENAIKYMVNQVDVIAGSIAIIIENSMMGEISRDITHAVNISKATKVLIPLNRCNVLIAGTFQKNLNELIDDSVSEIIKLIN